KQARSGNTRSLPKRAGRSAHEWKLNEWLIVKWPENSSSSQASHVRSRRCQDDSRKTAKCRRTTSPNIWQVETGKVYRVVELDSPKAVHLKEQLDVIV